MSKQLFDYLIEKYLNGTTTDEEKKLVEQWYSLVGDSSEIPTSGKEWILIKERIWRKISLQTLPKTNFHLSRSKTFKVTAIAASVVIILGVITRLMLVSSEPTEHTPSNELVTVSNTDDETKSILLSDNSVIILQKNASITYLRDFTKNQREVKLTGEAFFQIAKDSTKPFVVEAANTITRVLGTSFTIKEHKGEKVEVEVVSGLVSVYDKKSTDKKNNGVLLSANQQVTFHENENHFVIGLVAKPKPIAENDRTNFSLTYANTNLIEITRELEQLYGIHILFEKSATSKCRITGDLSGETLYDTLDIISLILNIDYRVQGTNILITGDGC